MSGMLRAKSLSDLGQHVRVAGENAKATSARNKFGAVKKTLDGIVFDSTHEAERYQLLKADLKGGRIEALKTHVPIQVTVNGEHVFTYLCDFTYRFAGRQQTIYEDAKGYRKGMAYQFFRLKKAVIKAALGIEVDEV